MKTPSSVWQHSLLIIGILLIAMNLRPAITALAPLVERMQTGGVDVQVIGLLTTLPLVLFGLAGLFVGAIGNRFGFARALGAGLMILSIGCFLRSWDFSGTNFERLAGSFLIGTGIAFGNVLLPGVVKSRYPNHVGLMTSLYSTAMNLGGTLGIALAVPLANWLNGGWNSSLNAWGYVALIPLLIWLPQLMHKPTIRQRTHPFAGIIQLLGRGRAWQVTAQMGLQSLLFYSSVAWLPTMLQLRGMSESQSYGWPTAMLICGCVASLIIPTLAGKARSQSYWTLTCATMTTLGLCGILWLPLAWLGPATLILGLGLNGGFSMSLLLIAMRSRDSETAGNLSSMAQAIGYLAAAPFPWFIGWLHTTTDSWPIAYGFLLIPALGLAIAGMLAGRPGFVK
jgi:CP family cyanate transporter-like MFS transporter